MPLYLAGIVTVLLQVTMIVHIMRTGRDQTWLWVVLLVPLVGSIAYLVVEVLPGMLGSRDLQTAANNLQDWVDPNRNYRKLTDRASITDSADSKRLLAEECLRKGKFGEAILHYRMALTGIHAEDPALLLGLAEAQVESGDLVQALDSLARLEAADARYHMPERRLFRARALEGSGDPAAAEAEYRAVLPQFPGPEAKYHYARFLFDQNRMAESQAHLQMILEEAKRSPRHAQRMNKLWIDRAASALRAFG